ncbi:MAG: glycerate kinase [Actinomyces sp.]|nr:glycerate kinase [Actinomyces sp.]MDN6794091.1 glycerate kinase [Propionibacterium sp.]
MARRVLLAGRWEDTGPGAAGRALQQVGQGMLESRPGTRVDTLPFGAGEAFREALEEGGSHDLVPVVVGVWEETTRRAGCEVLAALEAGRTPVVEGGHNIDVDAGLGMLEVLSGMTLPRSAALDRVAPEALEAARRMIAGRDILVAASTLRPLLGLASVMATGIDLAPRAVQDRELTAALARFFAHVPAPRRTLPVAGSASWSDPSRLPGSGAAGGAGAVLAALGARVVPTGDLLREVTGLDARSAECELVVVVEPLLHSPQLADALVDTLTAAAAVHALPVVAVGRETSLSAHEAAQWGLHGVITTGTQPGDLRLAGSRVARTWVAPHT